MANNLKVLKTRIKTVASTEKVTQAMKMITTSKFANSNARLNKLRDYFEVSGSVLKTMFEAFASDDLDLSSILAKKIYGKANEGTVLLVAITSDKGLCGAFNHNIHKALEAQIKECKTLGRNYKILPLGKKVREYTKNNHKDFLVDDIPLHILDIKRLSGDYINELKVYLKNILLQDDITFANIIHTKYVSSFVQEVIVKDIFPCYDLEAKNNEESKEDNPSRIETDIKASDSLERVFEDYLVHNLHNSLLNSLNSEYAIRMITMDNASTNAEDLIKKLTLKVNRTRQADVTNELVEIISGAEAV